MRTGVCLIVDLRQMLEIEMGIDLRGRDTGMTEHFLHRPQIAGALQHMGREGMTQLMRVHALWQALALTMLLQT